VTFRSLLFLKTQLKLEGCTMLNKHNTVFARSSPLYVTGVSKGPPESSTQTTSRSLQMFLQGSLGDRPTDRPRYSANNNRRSAQAKFCYCLWRQGVSLGPPESSTKTASRLLQPFLQASLGDGPTDRPRYSVGNNRSCTV